MTQQASIGFKSVQLFRDQILGIGSYGKVCKAECDGLLCAAKVIHETLFDPTAQQLVAPQKEHSLPMRRFEQECEFLSTIKHPNIIQYLGMHHDTDTCLPVLLMELMDDSLTHFLETSPQPIPYHIQVNTCHDITLALSFLHSNGIVHRDLSSNNVLMIGNIRAKVTDFGMARLRDLNPRVTATQCPGTDVYMPPEAVIDKPVYTEKIDCFSFGVIAIQIMTRLFPQPGDRRMEVEIENVGILEKRIPECERRKNHINKIDPNHPLLVIALDCLKDKDVERPSAEELCRRVTSLKQNHKYKESARVGEEQSREIAQREESLRQQHVRQIEGLQQIIQSQVTRLMEKDESIAALQESQQVQDVQQLREQHIEELQQLGREKDKEIERQKGQLVKQERELGRMNEQLETAEQLIVDFERRINELESQLNQNRLPQRRLPEIGIPEKDGHSIKLQWREGERAPYEMSSYCCAAVDTSAIYVRMYTHVFACSISTLKWTQLPDCSFASCPSVIVNDLPTLVGGTITSGHATNKLLSLIWEGTTGKWIEIFPPMPTKRYRSSALCTGPALVVAGGVGDGYILLAAVEVMNTKTHQWSTAADLPKPTYFGSLVQVSDTRIYMLGGCDKPGRGALGTKSVYTCTLNALLPSLRERFMRTFTSRANVWSQITDLPVTQSTCVSFEASC